ncbi:MAG: HAD family hydrolase [Solirubrobacteraceae bacterium]
MAGRATRSSSGSTRGDGRGGRPIDADPPTPAAFFDLDRTLIEGSSGIHFVRAAYRAGLVSRRRLARDLALNLQFRLRGSTDGQADAVRRRVGAMIAGIPVRDLHRLTHHVLGGVLPRLYPEMLTLAHEHQDAGRRIYICTAASQEMADLMALVLGFDGGLGSRSEVRDGVYTGHPGGPFAYADGKATLIAELAAAERISLADSYGYSDSASDLPMLNAVGFPVAVNPDRELARAAAGAGWPILRFRRRGRRIRVAGAFGLVGAAGVGAGLVLGRRGGSQTSRLTSSIPGQAGYRSPRPNACALVRRATWRSPRRRGRRPGIPSR